jgi:SAM-dependent methyltransferase
MTIIEKLKAKRVIGTAAKTLKKVLGRPSFRSSADYWERRYAGGRNSGAGSYGRLAQFKADFLNSFVSEHSIGSVIEMGSGDGAQLELANYPQYVGIDISPTVVAQARQRFAHDPSIKFLHTSEVTFETRAELAVSLDVIYHLVEDDVFETYINQLFDIADLWVIIYSSDNDEHSPAPHVRHRNFTKWVMQNRADAELVSQFPNPFPFDPEDPDNTSFADFFVYAKVGLPT